ncbi:MAG: PAS domain S-box protein [Desulfobacteraceae bacterium]|nr:MAG: PAS domain S-box protein [Desulfobacteraceae bacterium]
MDNDTPLYNSRIIKSCTEYLKKHSPEIDLDSILKYAEIEKYQLDDEGYWLSQEQINRFHDELSKQTEYQNIAREVGRFSVNSKASGALGQYILGFISPATAYSVVEKINARISRAAVLKTKSIGSDEIEVKSVLMPFVTEKPYQCQYRLGALEALAKLFTKKFAAIEHPVCIHKGGKYCLYRIRWENTHAYFWKKIRNYSFIVSVLALGLLWPIRLDAIVMLCILVAVLATFYSDHLEKKELHSQIARQGDSSDRLLDQIEKRSNESLLINEIGQAASMILETEELLKSVMASMEKRLNFERGMIMLADKNEDSLIYVLGYGFNPKDEDYLRSIRFNLNNPRSKGTAVNVFRDQKPVLVNDISEIEKKLSPKSLDFLNAMCSQSFICVPIVYESKSMGILIVDNVQSRKPLCQTDMNLLAGIAQQIGISINNAISYKKIRESEERFRALSENAPDIIYTLDNEGAFTYVNPAWEIILGYQKEDVIGKKLIDFTKKEDERRFIYSFKEIRDKGQKVYGLYGSILHKDGSECLFIMSGAPNTDSGGKVIGVVGTFKNVTDLKKAEVEKEELEGHYRQAQKMEAIGQLAGGVAHDFNNMLNIILGYSQVALMKVEPSDPLYTNIKEILNAANRSAELVRQLLAFARKQTIAPKALDLNQAVMDTLNMLRKLVSEDIDLIWMPAANLWPVTIDPAQVDQIVANLAVNARDSIFGIGTITIETSNAECDDSFCAQHPDFVPGQYVMLAIKDNGCGMEKETLEKIFDPFFTTKEIGKGTGMGLSTVYGIVKQNNGFVNVCSESGKGTVFRIYLPRCEKERMAIDEPIAHAKPLTGTETILLVEDNEALLKMGKVMLDELGYTVLAAGSPNRAIQLAGQYAGDIHLMVTDVVMPDMRVGDLLKRLSDLRPGIKCLFMSGYTANVIAHNGILDESVHFLQKPFSMNDLAAKVREALGGVINGKLSADTNTTKLTKGMTDIVDACLMNLFEDKVFESGKN